MRNPEKDDDYGHIDENQLWINVNNDSEGIDDAGDNFMDGDNRKSFLRNNKSHILYMWHLFDESQILQHTLSKLSASVTANVEQIPGANAPKEVRRRQKDDKNHQRQFQESVAASMDHLSKAQVSNQIIQQRKELRQLKQELKEADDSDEERDLEKEILETKKVITQLRDILSNKKNGGDNDGDSDE